MVLDRVWKSFAKVNVFLKVVGIRDNYHELSSRFVRVNDLYDEISFSSKFGRDYKHLLGNVEISEIVKKIMELEGSFACELEKNTIFKSAVKLLEFLMENEKIDEKNKVLEFLAQNKILVKKNITIGGGLAGGSSNAGTFLRILNEVLELNLESSELMKVGVRVGADVNFFLADVDSANVRGIGERIEVLDEGVIAFQIIDPGVSCLTKNVFTVFREKYLDEKNIDVDFVRTLETMSTKDILMQYEFDQLNDLLPAVLELYPELENYARSGWFLSGSGSSFFRKK